MTTLVGLFESHRPILVVIGGRSRLTDVSFEVHTGCGEVIALPTAAVFVALSLESFEPAPDARRRSSFEQRVVFNELVIAGLTVEHLVRVRKRWVRLEVVRQTGAWRVAVSGWCEWTRRVVYLVCRWLHALGRRRTSDVGEIRPPQSDVGWYLRYCGSRVGLERDRRRHICELTLVVATWSARNI